VRLASAGRAGCPAHSDRSDAFASNSADGSFELNVARRPGLLSSRAFVGMHIGGGRFRFYSTVEPQDRTGIGNPTRFVNIRRATTSHCERRTAALVWRFQDGNRRANSVLSRGDTAIKVGMDSRRARSAALRPTAERQIKSARSSKARAPGIPCLRRNLDPATVPLQTASRRIMPTR
jgi:hypothetical protein